MNNWISVKDQLPEVGDNVLLAIKKQCEGVQESIVSGMLVVENGKRDINEQQFVCSGCRVPYDCYYYNGHFNSIYNTNEYVTHWMPLPRPPKGE